MSARWIVGIDGSPASRVALDWALQHASGRGAHLVAVHAHHAPAAARLRATVSGGTPPPSDAGSLAWHELDVAITDRVEGLDVERRVVAGAPARALVTTGGEGQLLVVGRHGAGGTWHRAVGSVSRSCVNHSTVPVAVIPADWEPAPTRRIVVGFDGSEPATAALRWALEFADHDADHDAEVRAIAAIEVAPWLDDDLIASRLGEELQAEEARLRALLDVADPDGRAVHEVVVHGARPALARAAEHADLVVVGTRGAGRVAQALLGSVSTWMLDVGTRPLVVVPPPPT